MNEEIKKIINQYFSESAVVSIEESKGGAVNTTFHLYVEEAGEKSEYTMHKMNTIFDVAIMEDIDAITSHLLAKNINIQKVLRTLDNKLFVRGGGFWYRVLTYLPGKIFSTVVSGEQAREAGRLLGFFHDALVDFDYDFKFKLPHYHDTAFTIEELRSTLLKNENTNKVKYEALKDLATDILDSYEKIKRSEVLPERILHGDLKISNVVFDESGEKAVGLIDFDTLMSGLIALDLGDALRSWCMPGGEDVEVVRFDKNIYNATLEGYFSTAHFLTEAEKESIPYGVKLITLDLATRFVTDAFEEKYFKLDISKYKNLFEQNKKKAENQFAFFKKFSKSF